MSKEIKAVSIEILTEKSREYFDNPKHENRTACYITADGILFHGDDKQGKYSSHSYGSRNKLKVYKYTREDYDANKSVGEEAPTRRNIGRDEAKAIKAEAKAKAKEVKKVETVVIDLEAMTEKELIEHAVNVAGSDFSKNKLRKMRVNEIRDHIKGLEAN